MKKVLFAATALVAVGSMAAADVRISGYGRFGLDYNDGNSRATNNISKTTITSRLRLQFDMSAETDGGVAFGARYRAQSESRDNTANVGAFNGARFSVSYEGLTVMVGNIIGAYEGMPGMYLETRTAGTGVDGAGFVSHVGNVNGEYFNWDAYSSGGAGRNGVEVMYSSGAFSGHISYSENNGATATNRLGANVSYSFGDWRAAVGYQSSDVATFEDKLAVSLSGDIGNFGVRAAYGDNDGIGKYGLYVNTDIGAASNILLWVTREDAVSAADVAAGRTDNNEDGTSYGIHYSYDLGGGVSFETGYRRNSTDNDTFQAGVYFSF
jgi:outer membrane protein OmpU